MKKSSIGFSGVLLAFILAAGTSEGAVLKIWPDAFQADGIPLNDQSATLVGSHSPDMVFVYNAAQPKKTWYGWAPVNLPVGTVIKSVMYYHGPMGEGNYTSCILTRVKFGKLPTNIAMGSCNAAEKQQVTLTVSDPDALTIKAGFTYFVRIYVSEKTQIQGVKIFY